MSVYICVIDPKTEEDATGFSITSGEFGEFRTYVAKRIEGDFPILMGFDTWDGEWSVEEARTLAIEATLIEMELRRRKIPIRLRPEAMNRARHRDGQGPRSMDDYFITHDGESMAMTLRLLAEMCIELNGTIRSQ